MAYGYQILPPLDHCWPTGGYWLHNQQFVTVRPTVAFQPIFRLHVSVKCATGGLTVDFCKR